MPILQNNTNNDHMFKNVTVIITNYNKQTLFTWKRLLFWVFKCVSL